MKQLSYGRQNIIKADIEAVVDVLHADYLTQGPAVARFEKDLAQYCGAKYAVAVASGTAALHLAYLAAGLKAGDEIITTPNTFVATTNMLLAVGAKPVFCDIRLDTYNIDEQAIASLITDKTKAIVAVHFSGQPVALAKLWSLAAKHNLLVIEDAAHALGASYQGVKIGNTKSALACFSFHPVKSITTGEGGAVITNNEELFEKLKLLRSHGVVKDANGFNVMTELGYNYRITDLQCALGSSQLKRLDDFIARRNELVELYRRELADCDKIILPTVLAGNLSAWHLFVILIKESNKRGDLAKHLLANGIGVNYHYPPVYSQPYYRQHGYAQTVCPNAEQYFAGCLTLPLHTKLTDEDIKYVAKKIKDFFHYETHSQKNNSQ
jgi:perosamine synthetase